MDRGSYISTQDALGQWSLLALDLGQVEWDDRSNEELVSRVFAAAPLWLRIANFYQRSISVLKLLPPGQLVSWKLEHWGAQTPFERIPRSPNVQLPRYVEELSALGHTVRPYTFTARNRELLLNDIPALQDFSMDVVPIAQRPSGGGNTRATVRKELGLGRSDTLLGAGGLLHPAKGIDEIAEWFLRNVEDTAVQLICRVITDRDNDTEE